MPTYKDIERIVAAQRKYKREFHNITDLENFENRLKQLQAEHETSPMDIGDDVHAAYVSAGKKPETVEDVNRIEQFENNAKATNAIGLAAAAALPEMIIYGALPGLASYLTGTAAGIGGGYLGQKAGKYIDNKLGTSIFEPGLEFVGGLTSYGVGSGLLTKTAPYQIKKLNRSLSSIFGNDSGITKAGKTKVNWKWRNEGAYGDNTIYSRLYAKPYTIGHEYGHHISYNYPGLRSSDVLGAYTPGYEYASGIDPELNYAENFADWFKTVTGNKYTGSNQNLLSRQQAINNGLENTQFFGVVKPNGRVGESQLSIAKKLETPKSILKPRNFKGYSINPEAFSGVEHLTPYHYGYNRQIPMLKAKEVKLPAPPINVPSKLDRFLQKPIEEQNQIVRFWNGENYSSFNQLQNSKDYNSFINWLNKQK